MLDQAYHDKLLPVEICFESWFLISDDSGSIWTMKSSTFDFWKKGSIFSFRRQKTNSLIFCANISSDCSIWLKRYWNRVEWTQEMVFNTYHCINMCLDTKIKIYEKISKLFFPSVSNFVNSYFKWLPEKLFLSKKLLFCFYRKILFNLKILTDGISESRRQLKDDLGTRP